MFEVVLHDKKSPDYKYVPYDICKKKERVITSRKQQLSAHRHP